MDLPYKVELEHGDYYKSRRPEHEIVEDLVDAVNKIIAYLESKESEDKNG